MFRLTREVRFAVNAAPEGGPPAVPGIPTNSHAGFPSLNGLGHYFALRATLSGTLDPDSQYLINIKQIDLAVRDAVPLVDAAVRGGGASSGSALIKALFDRLRLTWPASPDARVALEALSLSLSPFLHLSILAPEYPMIRLSQMFEFSASHRLHNPALGDDENRRMFGKCNNPLGHGHNYEVQVTLRGDGDDRRNASAESARGLPVDVPEFERIVAQTVIDRFDHKNLNVEVPEFADLIPSVENIARVIYRLLAPKLHSGRSRLAAVTVWETPKTWCEYSEPA